MFFYLFSHISSFVLLSESTINQHIERDGGVLPIFILFGTLQGPNDPTRPAQAQFDAAAEKCNSMAKFLMAHQQMTAGLFRTYKVNRVPHFGFFHHGQYIPYPDDFPYDSDLLVDFIGNYLSRFVQPVNSSWANSDRKRVIYFSKRHTIPAYVSGIYGQFSPLLDFDLGFAHLDDDIQKAFPNATDGSLFFYNGTTGFEDYQGEKNPKNVSTALNTFWGDVGLTESTNLPKIN